MTEPNDVQSSLDRMKIHMELRGLRPNTVSTFARCARRFLAHTDKAPADVTSTDVEASRGQPTIDMGTLEGFPNPPAMVRGRRSRPAPHTELVQKPALSKMPGAQAGSMGRGSFAAHSARSLFSHRLHPAQ
jgi:hypothetical protein